MAKHWESERSSQYVARESGYRFRHYTDYRFRCDFPSLCMGRHTNESQQPRLTTSSVHE